MLHNVRVLLALMICTVANTTIANDFLESIKITQNKAAEYREFTQQVVNIAKNKSLFVTDNNSVVIDKWLSDSHTIKATSAISTRRKGLLIFVSFSMPDQLLIKLDAIARKAGGRLLIRGLKNNSFKETFAYIKQMQAQGIAIDIDPQAFEQFDVQIVPTFVLSEGFKYDKIAGNISVHYVLEQFAQHGDLSSYAKKYLKRLADVEVN